MIRQIQDCHEYCIEAEEQWKQEARLEVNKMRILRWMCGVTRRDKIQNEHIRGSTRVGQASKNVTEKRLKWYGHVTMMKEELRSMLDANIPGKRSRRRPNQRWKDEYKRYDTGRAEREQHDKQGRMEEENKYGRPQMMGQARDEEEEGDVKQK